MEKLIEFMMKKQDLMYSISEHFLVFHNSIYNCCYFYLWSILYAIQTYRQEVADHFNELDEDNRRLVVRGDIKQWNQMLAETAHNAAVYHSVFGGDVYLSLEEKVANLLFNEIGNSQVV